MTYAVSSTFVDESLKPVGAKVVKNFFIGSSNYSERVVRWPKFKRETKDFKITNLKINLVNHDGGLNNFYEQTYSLVTSSYIQYGFDYGGSQEVINVFTGSFSKVSYSGEKTIIHLKDKLYDMTQHVVGDISSPVDILSILPSELAWTLCTCYGQLSSVKSTSNPDIDYTSFNRFAEVWSDASIFVNAHYEGEKVSEALSRLSKITDSTIYGEGDGKIYFQRYSGVSTETTVITEDSTINLELDVLAKSLVNKQIIGWDYSQESDYSAKTIELVNTESQNSYGIYENTLEDSTVWFVNSTSALEMAQRMIFRYRHPPKLWKIKTPLISIIRQLGETAKLVNSFYNVTSAEGQRITGFVLDTHNDFIELTTDESMSFHAFVLDVDSLDHPNRYLL